MSYNPYGIQRSITVFKKILPLISILSQKNSIFIHTYFSSFGLPRRFFSQTFRLKFSAQLSHLVCATRHTSIILLVLIALVI